MKIKILIVLCLVAITYYGCSEKEVVRSDGISVEKEPSQIDLEKIDYIKLSDEYELIKVADYEMEARVLRKEKYTSDRASDVSPFDFAVGWKEMSSNELLKTLSIKQSNRFYFWWTNERDYPRKTIETQSANVHMIPGDDDVYDEMKSANKGSIIRATGYLVNVQSVKDGWLWKTSTTRKDVGNGACEILYVTKFEIVG